MNEKIPKVIHQIWIQGEQNIPDDLVVNNRKIKELHPEWKYVLWDEITILELLKKTNSEWYKNYYKFDYLHQKVDYAKLIILYIYGGIFIDMDAYTVKKLDSLFDKYGDYDFIVSYVNAINPVVNYGVCKRFGQCLNNGIFLGKPNTDILIYMLDNISYTCSNIESKMNCISHTTGPTYFDKYVLKYINDVNKENKSRILILDNEYLEPCTLNICEITGNTYIRHEHNLSWINYSLKEGIKVYLHNKIFFNTLFLIMFIVFCYLIIYYFSANYKKLISKIHVFI